MSDKPYNQLDPVNRMIQEACPVGMEQGVKLTIEYIVGFELFNTRPYHNFETWSGGYRVTDGETTVEREDLDDAIRAFVAKRGPTARPAQHRGLS